MHLVAKRVIACLDVDNGRVVKGTNFVDIRDAGDPVELAKRYSNEGIDEIVFLDITAVHEQRRTMADVVERVAKQVFVPLTVGGGIRSVEDASRLLLAGADKVGVNTAAVGRPELISELSAAFGAQATVLAIDSKKAAVGWRVHIHGGKTVTDLDTVQWAVQGQGLGAGEILLTSMDADGVQGGFDLGVLTAVCEATTIPIVASGGAGSPRDFIELFSKTDVSAGLAASIFHDHKCSISEVKSALVDAGIEVRR